VRWLAGLALAACGSSSTYRTTRIVPAGHTEWLFGAQASGAIAPGAGAAPLPELAVGARRGFADRYEVQANGTLLPIKQMMTGSLELAGKLRLVERGRWSLAVSAGAGYRIAESGSAIIEGVYASAPVIGGVELGRHQLVISVTGGFQRWYSSGARRVDVPFVGESIGFVWQVGEHWALLPETGAAWTPAPNFMTETSRLFHLGIAVLWTR
jgi:hypothetical protein